MKPSFVFIIDVVGACNLKCPTCPNGNYTEVRNPAGFMTEETLREILEKATRECEVTKVCLFNWYEPLLHPRLPELIRIVKSFGLSCTVSSNLNLLRNPDAILAANPDSFRISISGFTQENYGVTHQGGDIEKVKTNMRLLAESRKRVNSSTAIYAFFHRYLGNLDDEVRLRKYARELGFDFDFAWAYFMPLEKTLALVDPTFKDTSLTEKDREVIDRLAMPLPEVLAAAKANRHIPCSLRDQQMTIDFQGRVQLCCGVFDFSKYSLGKYLDIPHERLQDMKNAHEMCARCMNHGLHAYLVCEVPGLDRMAKLRVNRHYADNDFSMEFPGLLGATHKLITRGLRRLRRLF